MLYDAQAGATVDKRLRTSVARWCGRLDTEAFERDVERSAKLGGFLMPGDPLWPENLMDLGETRPLGLWYHGNPEVLKRLSLAIVGSRDATDYGLRIARDLAFELSEQGVVIVSGGAFGIDTAAHRGALAANGQTVAVLAGGVDRPYPQNALLFGEVLAAGGVIVSGVATWCATVTPQISCTKQDHRWAFCGDGCCRGTSAFGRHFYGTTCARNKSRGGSGTWPRDLSSLGRLSHAHAKWCHLCHLGERSP